MRNIKRIKHHIQRWHRKTASVVRDYQKRNGDLQRQLNYVGQEYKDAKGHFYGYRRYASDTMRELCSMAGTAKRILQERQRFAERILKLREMVSSDLTLTGDRGRSVAQDVFVQGKKYLLVGEDYVDVRGPVIADDASQTGSVEESVAAEMPGKLGKVRDVRVKVRAIEEQKRKILGTFFNSDGRLSGTQTRNSLVPQQETRGQQDKG
eukprot:scaffold30_cov255-Pinguiococcus_pyrenoidosus.AAC.21